MLLYGGNYHGKLQNEVTSISDCGQYLRVNGNASGQDVNYFKVVDTSKPQKHRDLIIAWANGAEMEYMNDAGKWSSSTHPTWSIYRSYRIKRTKTTELEKLIKEHKAMGETIDKLTKELMNE